MTNTLYWISSIICNTKIYLQIACCVAGVLTVACEIDKKTLLDQSESQNRVFTPKQLEDSVSILLKNSQGIVSLEVVNNSTDTICILTSTWIVQQYAPLCSPFDAKPFYRIPINELSFHTDSNFTYLVHADWLPAIHRPDHEFTLIGPKNRCLIIISGIIVPDSIVLPWIRISMPVWHLASVQQSRVTIPTPPEKKHIIVSRFARISPHKPTNLPDSLIPRDCCYLYCDVDLVPNVSIKPDSSYAWGLPRETAAVLYKSALRGHDKVNTISKPTAGD